MRRLPPQNVQKNLSQLISLLPDVTEDLLSCIDQPLTSRVCSSTGRDFLICDYNRDGNSYRSPWSNAYDPPLQDATFPLESTRQLEIVANEAFDTFRELYYEGGISSVYMWDLESNGLAAAVLIKKQQDQGHAIGSWNSIHVFEIQSMQSIAHYKLTSTVILELSPRQKELGKLNLSGSLTRQAEASQVTVKQPMDHIAQMGKMVEEMEAKIRSHIHDIYFGKTKDIINELRSLTDLQEAKKQAAVKSELAAKLTARKKVE